MNRLLPLAAMVAIVCGLALSPALAKNDKPEKEKSNKRVEKILVCHVNKTEADEAVGMELRSGQVVAVPAQAVEAHLAHGDVLLYDENGELIPDVETEEGEAPAQGDACSFWAEMDEGDA